MRLLVHLCLCRFHERIDDCTRLCALGCIGKEPSLPANDKGTDGVFYLVVADFNFAMRKERTEVRKVCSEREQRKLNVVAYTRVSTLSEEQD